MTRRLQVLFLLALLGVLAAAGLVLADVAGPLAAAAYALVVLAGLLYAASRARAAATPPPGRTCSCCTSTVHDPVEVR